MIATESLGSVVFVWGVDFPFQSLNPSVLFLYGV
jgi:hypothetical protein